MRKLFILLLIAIIMYLAMFAIFNDKPMICEPLINLNLYDENQMITYKNIVGEEYVLIRMSDLDVELRKELFRKLMTTVYSETTTQDINYVINNLAPNNGIEITREPILAVKLSDINRITNNKILSGSLRRVKENTILIPYSSNYNPDTKQVNGDMIRNIIVTLDKILLLDTRGANTKPSNVGSFLSLYLNELYEHQGTKIYMLSETGEISNKINLV